MNRWIIAAVVAGLGVSWLTAPTLAAEQAAATSESESAQTSEALKTLKTYSLEKKNEAVAYGKRLLKETDAKIAQLQAKASKVSGEAKAAYDKQMADLEVQRSAAAAKLDEMQKKSGHAWNDAKQGFAEAYKELQHAYDKAVRQFN